jgi:ABC-type branched-subunit amino acid transport system substrate-binding protein
MLRRALFSLATSVALSACQPAAIGPAAPPLAAGAAGAAGAAAPAPLRVALLAPLSGPRAEIGASLQRGAQLALPVPTPAAGGPVLDTQDTGGTPEGAARAARAALAGGAGLLIGPLTAGETATVAQVAQPAGVPVLAFTNDATQARPGVWTLGITPRQQVERLLVGVQMQGKTRTAALLPQNELGRVMAAALRDSAEALGLPAPILRDYPDGMAGVTAAVKDISDYADRRGLLDAEARADRATGDPLGRQQAAAAERAPVAPPPFDAILLADTGTTLGELASLLPFYDVSPSQVQFLGPAIWASGASGSRQLPGAWYAAPDPAARASFVAAYQARFGAPPPPLADLAYDAASIARAAAAGGGFAASVLTAPGYNGVDGPLILDPDGHVRRALAVFSVGRGGNQLVQPAPQTVGGPVPPLPAPTAPSSPAPSSPAPSSPAPTAPDAGPAAAPPDRPAGS